MGFPIDNRRFHKSWGEEAGVPMVAVSNNSRINTATNVGRKDLTFPSTRNVQAESGSKGPLGTTASFQSHADRLDMSWTCNGLLYEHGNFHALCRRCTRFIWSHQICILGYQLLNLRLKVALESLEFQPYLNKNLAKSRPGVIFSNDLACSAAWP